MTSLLVFFTSHDMALKSLHEKTFYFFCLSKACCFRFLVWKLARAKRLIELIEIGLGEPCTWRTKFFQVTGWLGFSKRG